MNKTTKTILYTNKEQTKLKKLLGIKRRTSSVKKLEDFINRYGLNTDRISIRTITFNSELVPFLKRRKSKIRRKGGTKNSTDYVICDGRCLICPSKIRCLLFLKEETLWD
jgi:hypothetical protein